MKPSFLSVVAVMVAVTNPISAMAAAYLCVEDAITGFNWEGGKWVQRNFRPQQRLIRKHALDDRVAVVCGDDIAQRGLKTEIGPSEVLAFIHGCYSRTEVGAEVGYADLCREWLVEFGKVTQVACSQYGAEYEFNPAGAYLSTTTFGALGSYGSDDPRDSLGIAVGRCSTVSP
jgi:hypothetical protein